MKLYCVLGMIFLFVAKAAVADFIYHPSSDNEENPDLGGFSTITIPTSITEDLGGGLFRFHSSDYYFCCIFLEINGTLNYENGEVTRWDFTHYWGDERTAGFTNRSRFDGISFFEYYEVENFGPAGDGGVVYSKSPGTWAYTYVPPPPPPPTIPIPASFLLFLVGISALRLAQIRQG